MCSTAVVGSLMKEAAIFASWGGEGEMGREREIKIYIYEVESAKSTGIYIIQYLFIL